MFVPMFKGCECVCRVYECVALTQLGPSLAELYWAARVPVDLWQTWHQSLGYLQSFEGYRFAVWFAGEHCEAESPFPQLLRECERQPHVDFRVPRTCMHVCVSVCVYVCVMRMYAHPKMHWWRFRYQCLVCASMCPCTALARVCACGCVCQGRWCFKLFSPVTRHS
jgi:hypothetical protein